MFTNHAIANEVQRFVKEFWPVTLVAFLSLASVIACLDPAGSYPHLPEGPGLTVDEFFNVTQGVYLVEQARSLGWLNLVPGTSIEMFRPVNGYNPDHPPLGRWWLGVHHHLTWWISPPFEPEDDSFVIACARTGSATAFALTVLLIGIFTTIWSGRRVGILSALSLVLMPRVFGHAHLASLETMTNLMCTTAVLSVAHWWNRTTPPNRLTAILTGTIMGLALLTKIQAVLIPIPVACWALWKWRRNAVLPLVIWGISALVVFFASWPYLWLNPQDHLLEYLGRTTNRATLQVWYLGEKFPDKLVPWHYSFVIFGLTIPIILQLMGILGAIHALRNGIEFQGTTGRLHVATPPPQVSSQATDRGSRHQPGFAHIVSKREGLLLACMLFPLTLFALPGIAVYDCERLFLPCFPLWAIFVGKGWEAFEQMLTQFAVPRSASNIACAVLLVIAGTPLVTTAPCHLSYYNEVVTILLGGADRVGLEVDYWGEGVTRRLLQRLVDTVPRGATVAVLPTLHQFQAADYRRQSPTVRAHELRFAEFSDGPKAPDYVLAFRRRADLSERWERSTSQDTLGATVIHGRLLAYFIRYTE